MSKLRTGSGLVVLFTLALILSPPTLGNESTASTASTASTTAEPCVPAGPRPPVELPWDDVDELCAADFGQPLPADLHPPDDPGDEYAEQVESWLGTFAYRELGWIHDARWRATGDFAGCPSDSETFWTNGVHPLVRIYYSPGIMEWLCEYRRTEEQAPDPADVPPGEMIVKEMVSPADGLLYYQPDGGGTGGGNVLGKVWIDGSQVKDGDLSWTVMIKGEGSYDGWYWANLYQYTGTGEPVYGENRFNPPILGRSGFTTAVDDETGYPVQLPNPPANGKNLWYPTYWEYTVDDVTFPNYGYGSYCIYCHGSAAAESTFSSLTNVLDEQIRYDYLASKPPSPAPSPAVNDHVRGSEEDESARPVAAGAMGAESAAYAASAADAGSRAPFPDYAPINVAAFEKTYPQFAGLKYDDVWPLRLPAELWDHVVSGAEGPEQFLTSDQCFACHEAGGASQRLPNMVVVQENEDQIDLSPYAEWRGSPMGLAGRDPIFFSMLESELNRAQREPGLESYLECIQNTCLHCHGNMGQRQQAIDTRDPANDPCRIIEQATDPSLAAGEQWTAEDQIKAGYGGRPFLRSTVNAWRDEDPANARYGGLARDGISCTTCHHISTEDLDLSGKTFTGNFRVGPADEIYGPFDQDVRTDPMEHSLGITPMLGEATLGSELCGSCHSIYLPIFDNRGEMLGSGFEQTTYLEWLNSAFNESNPAHPRAHQSCQDCHMRDSYVYYDDDGELLEVSLAKEKIANVQDDTFPPADFLSPQLEEGLVRRDYRRHTFYGLNVFLNAYFQQFPLLLGLRQQDFMNGNVRAPLLVARDEALLIARLATAKVRLGEMQVDRDAGTLSVEVTVENRGGHKLPSGVGFRRAFVELLVLDGAGEPLWASGRSSQVGVLLDGLSDKPLATEFLPGSENTPGEPCPDAYQPHYQVITEPCQVQIYEELVQDSARVFTTSFLHRVYHVKDNRLLPEGYRVVAENLPPEEQPAYCAPWCAEANPHGEAEHDPDYQGSGPYGVKGEDRLTYRITLPADVLGRAARVQATLYSQATAPYFLDQRFDQAKAGPRDQDAKRLYFITGHLNTDAKAKVGTGEEKYIDQYRLMIYRASRDLPAGGP